VTLDVLDQLPAGMQYDSFAIVTSAAASNGFLAADFNGTVNAPLVSGGAFDGDDVTFAFSNTIANADGIAGNNTFLLLVTARVTDVPANVSGATLLNVATFDDPNDPPPPFDPPPVPVNVIEPVLTIDKEFDVIAADAGDTVSVSITVTNTGTGPAYDVAVNDIVDLLNFGTITEVTTPAGFTFNNAAGTVSFTGGNIAAGASETFIFSVRLTDAVNPSAVLANTASATATSQPGIVPGERAFGPVQDTDTLDVPPVFDLVKNVLSPVSGNVLIGDIVTYSVNVTLVEGTTNNIALTDLLPAGTTYLNGSAVVSNANGMTVNGFAANAVGNTLTITATSIVNPGNVDNTATTDSDTFTIIYQTVVNDVPGNVAGTLLPNNLTGDGDGVPPGNPPPVTVTVTEPSLQLTKIASDSTLDLGQIVRFSLIIENLAVPDGADAYDILVRDALPAGLSNLSNISVFGALVDVDSSTASLLDLKLNVLAYGATAVVEFDATVDVNPLLVGTDLDNNARVYWDTQPGEGPNVVLAGGVDGDEDRDYGATGPDEPFNTDVQPEQDTERVTINANSLSGTVYQDVNEDGDYDAGTDALLDGVSVTITGNLAADGSFYTATVASVAGVYTFNNLAAGSYTLTESQPLGYVDGGETVGAPFGGTASTTLGSDTISSLVIPAGASGGSGYDFGEVLGSSLAGSVFEDQNNDGFRIGEPGVGGVSVTFSGTDFLGEAVTFTLPTDGNGDFLFGAGQTLRPGIYTVTENAQPAGYLDGTDVAGSSGGIAGNEVISAIVLPQGAAATDYTFGELLPATLSGSIYHDANNDGIFAGETGIGGVAVTVNGTDDFGAIAPVTVLSNPDGSYAFGNLRPGVYIVTAGQPPGYLDGADTAGAVGGGIAVNGATDSDEINSITLASGLVSADNNFGDVLANTFGGAVYFDLNNDGARDPGEPGISGVTITLGGSDDRGNPVNVTDTTDGTGAWSFVNLRPGTYTVTETQPAIYNDGIDTLGTVGGVPNGITGADQFTNVTLVSGEVGADYLFGERGTTVTGTVFRDVDKAGDLDAGTDPGIGGVTLTLRDSGGIIVATAVSLPDGSYLFDNVVAGNYTITETQPTGYGSSTPNTLVAPVTLGGLTGQDFGDTLGLVSGSVFRDDNGDGILNGGDAGLVTTVTLTGTNALGQPVNIVLTTNPDGTYSFDDLLSGTYSVAETQPATFGDGTDFVGTSGGSNAVNDVISGIALAPGVDGTGYDFTERFDFAPVKTIVSTNNPGTSGVNVTIGESIRYRLVVALPEGNLGDYVIADSLPAGLVFLDDGTSAVAFVSNDGTLITSSTLGAAPGSSDPLVTPAFLLPASAISNSANADTDGWRSGTDVFFRLGDIVNADNAAADPAREFVIIEFNARVANEINNQSGRVFANTFSPRYDTSGDGINDPLPPDVVSPEARVIAVEPILSLDKRITGGPSQPKSGDVITFTVTISHAAGSGATAWETIFTDQLPPGLQFVSAVTSAKGGAVVTGAATADGVGGISGEFDIPVGGEITITYQAKVGAGVKSGTVLTNGADVTWTSAPGDVPSERRSGDSLLNKGGLNDYELQAQAKITVINPAATPFLYAYDSFNNWAREAGNVTPDIEYRVSSPDIFRGPLLPLAPVYSGEADPGAILVVEIFNANGDSLGQRTVVVDAGGNWMATFNSTIFRDYPSTARITQLNTLYGSGDNIGNNLRAYYSPALNPGHFFFSNVLARNASDSAPLLSGLGLENPISLGLGAKYGGELLSVQSAAGGY
jgi:uncharacterized repeat protein (TIGR01451 family)/fimbrial isopeptide formation D2 family protein